MINFVRRVSVGVMLGALWGLGGFGLAWGASSSAQPVAGSGPVKVGVIAPLSGGSAGMGISMRHGIELATQEINEVGGYMGRRFELVIRDDKGDPETGRQLAQQLIQDERVAFTLGYCNTGVAVKALPFFEQAKHLLIVPCAQGTAVTTTTPAASSYVFRLAPRDDANARVLVADVVKRRGFKKVAIFADNTAYGEGGLGGIEKELARLNLKPVYVHRFNLGVKSLTDPVREAVRAGAELMLSYTVGPEQAVLARARGEAGHPNLPLSGPWTLSYRGVLDAAGSSAVEGASMVQSIINNTQNERRSAFLAKYNKYTNGAVMDSLMSAAQGYDATYLALWALFQAKGDTSGDAMKAALENLHKPFPGVVTTYQQPFSSQDHDALSENMLWMGVWRKGRIEFLYDEDRRRSAEIRKKAPLEF